MLEVHLSTFAFTHQPTHTPHLSYSTMCRWRHVRNVYLRCGHTESLPPVEVKCTSIHCKFSPYHPSDCVACSQTCNQYHLYPEHYSPNVDGYCSACRRADSRSRRY
ncbi:hypothetical protein B0H19DRAFT_1121436 [Mycena capillaripes]|nr:hypothetical protein B0H19DRAFT_1121436 [Mycena capillaripes]